MLKSGTAFLLAALGMAAAGALRARAGGAAPLPSVATATGTPTWTPTHHVFPTLTPTPTPDPTLLRVTAVAPASGPAAGGTAVTISGANFVFGASVALGGAAAGDVVVVDAGQITATVPPLPAGFLADVQVTNPSLETAFLHNGWFADFLDVASSNLFHDDVVRIARGAITAGCGGGMYCPTEAVTRAQMAVLVLKTKYGWGNPPPPPCTGVFADVACPGAYADWIEFLYQQGITAGCGGGNYCPDAPIARGPFATILLKARHGWDVVPPPCQGVFSDVPCPGPFADWIEMLASEGITSGCGGGNYCPNEPVLRGPIATLLAKSFYITPAGMPGPALSRARD